MAREVHFGSFLLNSLQGMREESQRQLNKKNKKKDTTVTVTVPFFFLAGGKAFQEED